MELKSTDLISLFERSLQELPDEKFDEIGTVVQLGDGICRVHGLKNAMQGECVTFEGGNSGIVMQLDEDIVSVFLLHASIPVKEFEIATRTGQLYTVPVSKKLCGRVINALGKPIDGLGEIQAEEFRPVEREIAGIIDRTPVNESLETGIMAVDTLVPIGKGQRELLIGNRNTGKTALALDAILHQKDKKVMCIYVAIGQREANLARMVRLLEENGALEYTVVVCARAGEAVLNQYLAPYVGCTIGEYFMDRGQDALVIYDDLSNHAIAFREMSLLLRRPPGREAYPGDVFYLHSRLLERAGKLKSGGSLTALPIVQIQGDDITSYIPTNLISITDGQIFLDTKLFNQGFRPAVNAELSVSRVGGAAQTKAIKRVAKSLRLELAQYNELLDFAQFGTELDDISKRRLERGARAIELLKQSQYVTYSFVDQVIMLVLLRENLLDQLPLKDIHAFATQFVSYVQSVHAAVYNDILDTKDLSDASRKALVGIAQDFSKIFIAPETRV